MGPFYRYVKQLSGQHITGTDTAADHSGSRAVYAGVRTLGAAQPELHDSVTAGGVAYPGGLGSDQALVVDDIQNGSFNQLGLHNGSDNLDHGFSGEHDAPFRDGINAA